MRRKKDSEVPVYRVPPLSPGQNRQWLQCRRCKAVYWYDYTSYGLSNPIRWTSCGHGISERDLGCNNISVEKAYQIISHTHRLLIEPASMHAAGKEGGE
jgi:hypothetical protein